eukprot:3975935-Pleurochrysis_carterae.AAC.4
MDTKGESLSPFQLTPQYDPHHLLKASKSNSNFSRSSTNSLLKQIRASRNQAQVVRTNSLKEKQQIRHIEA